MSDEKTTISVSKEFRDTVKEHREYPNEPLEKVLQRELGDTSEEPEFERVATQEDIRRLLNRIDDAEIALTTQIERLQE